MHILNATTIILTINLESDFIANLRITTDNASDDLMTLAQLSVVENIVTGGVINRDEVLCMGVNGDGFMIHRE